MINELSFIKNRFLVYEIIDSSFQDTDIYYMNQYIKKENHLSFEFNIATVFLRNEDYYLDQKDLQKYIISEMHHNTNFNKTFKGVCTIVVEKFSRKTLINFYNELKKILNKDIIFIVINRTEFQTDIDFVKKIKIDKQQIRSTINHEKNCYYEYLLNNLEIKKEEYNYDINDEDPSKISLYENEISEYGIPIKVNSNGEVFYYKKINNSIVIGNTGSGKTTNISLIYTLMALKANSSCVVVDTKGTIRKYTYDLARQKGYKIYNIDFSEKSKSDKINIFAEPYRLSKSDLLEDRELANDSIGSILELLKEKQVNDVFWENSSIQTIEGLIHILFKVATDESQITFRQLFNLYNQSQNRSSLSSFDLKDYVNKFLDNDNVVIKSLLSSYLNARKKKKKSMDAVISEKLSRFLKNESLLFLMSRNDVDFEDLINQKTIIYLNLPDLDVRYHHLTAIVLKQICNYLTRKADREFGGCLPKKVSLILEEAGQYKINGLPSLISTSRSRNIEILMLLQSFSQLKDKYSELDANIIIENCCIIYLYSKDKLTLDYLQDLCGEKIEYYQNKLTKKDLHNRNIFLNLPMNYGIVHCGRSRAFITKYTPIYKLNLKIKKINQIVNLITDQECNDINDINFNEFVSRLREESSKKLEKSIYKNDIIDENYLSNYNVNEINYKKDIDSLPTIENIFNKEMLSKKKCNKNEGPIYNFDKFFTELDDYEDEHSDDHSYFNSNALILIILNIFLFDEINNWFYYINIPFINIIIPRALLTIPLLCILIFILTDRNIENLKDNIIKLLITFLVLKSIYSSNIYGLQMLIPLGITIIFICSSYFIPLIIKKTKNIFKKYIISNIYTIILILLLLLYPLEFYFNNKIEYNNYYHNIMMIEPYTINNK